jgi:hypothetical protein
LLIGSATHCRRPAYMQMTFPCSENLPGVPGGLFPARKTFPEFPGDFPCSENLPGVPGGLSRDRETFPEFPVDFPAIGKPSRIYANDQCCPLVPSFHSKASSKAEGRTVHRTVHGLFASFRGSLSPKLLQPSASFAFSQHRLPNIFHCSLLISGLPPRH